VVSAENREKSWTLTTFALVTIVESFRQEINKTPSLFERSCYGYHSPCVTLARLSQTR